MQSAELGLEGKTVLVVDDHPAMRSVLVEALGSFDWRVLVASDGTTAAEIIRKEEGSLDLVISDIEMPQMDGLELARRFAAKVPFVLSSGATPPPEKASIEAGARVFLPKPYGLDEFFSAVGRALGISPEVFR